MYRYKDKYLFAFPNICTILVQSTISKNVDTYYGL